MTAYLTRRRIACSQINFGEESSLNNSNERLNREICRRTDVVEIRPDQDAIIRLVGAVLAEQRDEWADSRCYVSLDALTKSQSVGTDQPEDMTPDLHARSA